MSNWVGNPGRPSFLIPHGSAGLKEKKVCGLWIQRLIHLEIPILVRLLKSSNVELGYYLYGTLFKCCLSDAVKPQGRLDLISSPILVVGSVLMQS